MDRTSIEQQIRGYFADIDRFDLDAVFARMADGVRLQVEPANVGAEGKAAVREMYEGILADSVGMTHELLGLAVDETTRRAAIELLFRNETREGTRIELHDVTWIELDAQGLIARVAFWMGHDALAPTP